MIATLHRTGVWLGHQVTLGMAWFDGLSGWQQLALVLVVLLAVCAAMHFDDLRREREWCAFRRWLHEQYKPLKGLKVR